MLTDITAGFGAVLNRVAYMRKKPEDATETRLTELKHSIDRTVTELNCAMENFNNVTEPKLIDFYIYKIQSEQTRYDQLLCEYKTLTNL